MKDKGQRNYRDAEKKQIDVIANETANQSDLNNWTNSYAPR